MRFAECCYFSLNQRSRSIRHSYQSTHLPLAEELGRNAEPPDRLQVLQPHQFAAELLLTPQHLLGDPGARSLVQTEPADAVRALPIDYPARLVLLDAIKFPEGGEVGRGAVELVNELRLCKI